MLVAPGVSQAERAPLGVFPKREIPFPADGRLTPLVGEFYFFTPAVLYLYSGFFDGVWIDLAARCPSFSLAYLVCRDRPLFGGLATADGDSTWNHGLFAVPIEFQAETRLTLSRFTGMNQAAKAVCFTGVTKVPVGPPGSVVSVDAFVSAGNRRTYLIAPDLIPPSLVRQGPDPQAVACANQMFSPSATQDEILASFVGGVPESSNGKFPPPPVPAKPLGPIGQVPSWLVRNGQETRRRMG